MTTRVLLPLVFCLFAPPCVAAPAPFPKTNLPAADVVFDASNPDRPRRVAAYLRSAFFAETFAESAGVKDQLAHLKTAAELRAWLRERLHVTHDGKLVRVRVVKQSGALAALRNVTGRLTTTMDDNAEEPQIQKQKALIVAALLRREMQQAQWERMRRGGGKLTKEQLETMEAESGRFEIESNPLKVRSAPRDLGRSR